MTKFISGYRDSARNLTCSLKYLCYKQIRPHQIQWHHSSSLWIPLLNRCNWNYAWKNVLWCVKMCFQKKVYLFFWKCAGKKCIRLKCERKNPCAKSDRVKCAVWKDSTAIPLTITVQTFRFIFGWLLVQSCHTERWKKSSAFHPF